MQLRALRLSAVANAIRNRFYGAALDLRFDNTSVLDPRITFTRASNATQFDSSGTLVYAPHNLLLWSEDFSNAVWTNNRITVNTDATTAPSGTLTADKLVATAVLGDHGISASNTTIAPGSSVTSSVFVRKAEYRYAYLWLDNGSGIGQTLELDFDTGITRFTRTDTANYSGVTSTVSNIGGGWFRISISATTTYSIVQLRVYMSPTAWVSGNFGTPQFTGDGTSGIFVWGAQLNQTPVFGGVTASLSTYYPTTSAAYYGPRFDYDPVTLAARGLLIEEQRTNLLTWSENFGDAVWGKTAATVTTNAAVGPDGTSTADKLIDNITSGQHFTFQNLSIAANAAYTFSIYVKSAEYQFVTLWLLNAATADRVECIFNLGTGQANPAQGQGGLPFTSISASILNVGNGWYRCAVSGTSTGGAITLQGRILLNNGSTTSFAGDGTSGILLWGAQLEAGAFPTSYIPTTSATATRAADSALMTGTNFSSWYNATEGTLFAEGIVNKVDSQNWLATLRETGVDYMAVRGTAATLVAGIVRKSASANGDLNATVPTYAAGNRIAGALAYRLADYAFAAQGLAAIGNQTNYVIAPTSLDIAALSTTNLGNLHIRRIVYWPVRLSNAALQALTA